MQAIRTVIVYCTRTTVTSAPKTAEEALVGWCVSFSRAEIATCAGWWSQSTTNR